MLKVAVVGLGDIAKIHIPAILSNQNVELVAVCDVDEALKDFVPNVRFYTDYLKMLEEEALDCVHICLPHYLHFPVTKACVEKGVNVLQEKPLSLNIEECKELLELEKKNKNVKICICFQNRFNETVEKLQGIVKSGKYGKIVGIKGLVTWFRPKVYYESKPWRGKIEYAGGGVMMNQAIHTLDLMQLLGGEIESIRGMIDKLLDYDIEVEDTSYAHITFKNGAKGLFFATLAYAGNSSIELQVLLEKGKFTIKDSILTGLNDDGKKIEIVEDQKLPGTKFYYGASHIKLINHFYSCIENNNSDYVSVKDAITSIQIIDAIRKSSIEKKEMKLEELVK